MKQQLIIVIIFSTFIFANCKKDSNEPEGNYFGYAKATINGNIITYNKCAANFLINNTDSIGLSFERWEGLILKEKIGFQKIYKNATNSQRIYKYTYVNNQIEKLSSGYYTLRDDGDVLCDVYDVYETDSLQNFITITSYNTQTKEIRGTFQATYLIDSARLATIGRCRATAPDTIRIRNGEFYTKFF